MANKLMYIPNYDTQNYTFCTLYNYWLKRLDALLNEQTNLNFKKVINSPVSPPFKATWNFWNLPLIAVKNHIPLIQTPYNGNGHNKQTNLNLQKDFLTTIFKSN